MKLQKLLAICFLVVMLTIQTGCTPQNELGNLSVITGFYLDSSREEYILLADCLDFAGQSQNEGTKTKKIRVTGTTLDQTFAELQKQSQTPLCFSRAKVLLMKNPKTDVLQALFDLRILPSDILILKTDLTENELLETKENSFSLGIDTQLKTSIDSSQFKLYQLIKNPENNQEIPIVLLSENGFYLRFIEGEQQKEGTL